MNQCSTIALTKIPGIKTTTLHEKGEVCYLTYDRLDGMEGLCNAFSTRLGGVSKYPFGPMNLSFTIGDDPSCVQENFRRMGEAMGVLPEQMVYSHQTHTNHVMVVGKEHLGMGILKERSFHDVDGIITNVPGVCLVTSYADCVPLYVVDPKKRVIGLSHSGWKGTVGDIGGNTVRMMESTYGCDPKDLVAAIGPSIGVECYEVSEDVAEKFRPHYSKEEQEKIILPGGTPGKYQLNLQQACVYNFLHAGMELHKIILPDLCTACNSTVLHSHRKSGGRRGGMCAFFMLQE
ncbi:MAG: peptidoglycan editing factor PgeF [Lachnospiraceae bacterium]|nr:peptidoglycan editing factor PgeF [Lachnospiraceae bacterium]